jgi:guanylate kinase
MYNDTQKLIAKDLLSIKAVFFRPEEPFTWASGIKSPVYCDNRLTLTSVKVRTDVETSLANVIKENYPDGVFIFILPPSMSELRKRLTGRGTETAEAIELRLSKTLSEIEYVDKYDYLVVNGELDEAVNRVKAIIIAEHSKVTMTPEELVREYTEGEEE